MDDDGGWQPGAAVGSPCAPLPLREQGRQLRDDAVRLAASIRGTAVAVERRIAWCLEERPLSSFGVAVATGYLIGGGLNAQLSRAALGAMTKVAVAVVARELFGRSLQHAQPRRARTAPGNHLGATKERT